MADNIFKLKTEPNGFLRKSFAQDGYVPNQRTSQKDHSLILLFHFNRETGQNVLESKFLIGCVYDKNEDFKFFPRRRRPKKQVYFSWRETTQLTYIFAWESGNGFEGHQSKFVHMMT